MWVLIAFGVPAYGLAFAGWWLVDADQANLLMRAQEAAYAALSVVAPSDVYTAQALDEAGVEAGSGARWTLVAARWLGAVFFALTLAKVVLLWAYQAAVKWRARVRNEDHVVVVGKQPFADRAAEEAAERGLSVVQFEPGGKETVPDGVLTLDSDMGLVEMLRWSAAHKARALVFATTDNAENADLADRVFADTVFQEKAQAASELGVAAGKARAGPHIFVVTDDAWYERREELNYGFHQVPEVPSDGNRLDSVVEFVGESRAAARAVMTAEPVFRLQRAAIQHIVIVGFGAMGQAILAEYCETQRTDPDRQQWVTILDPDPGAWTGFVQRVPAWADVFDGAFFPCAVETLDERAQAFAARLRAAPPAAIYVTTGAGLDSMAASADVKRIISDLAESGAVPEAEIGCPVFACARGGSGQLVGDAAAQIPAGTDTTVMARMPIVPFGSWRDVVSACRILDDQPDLAAFKVHATHNNLYSPTLPTNWSHIAEVNRYSSRSAASYVPALLHAAGFDLGPWLAGIDGQPPSVNRLPRLAVGERLVDGPSTLVRLARLEHARWCAERYLRGFRRGPKDLARKRHPGLVPFDDLDAGAKSYNIQYVALLQSMLLDGADGPVIARPPTARRPVMRPTDTALVEAAEIAPDLWGGAAAPAPSPPTRPQETGAASPAVSAELKSAADTSADTPKQTEPAHG
ncbi:MAG: RyR domain-containing protein [Pseudomonadota bacterium]